MLLAELAPVVCFGSLPVTLLFWFTGRKRCVQWLIKRFGESRTGDLGTTLKLIGSTWFVGLLPLPFAVQRLAALGRIPGAIEMGEDIEMFVPCSFAALVLSCFCVACIGAGIERQYRLERPKSFPFLPVIIGLPLGVAIVWSAFLITEYDNYHFHMNDPQTGVSQDSESEAASPPFGRH